MKIRFLVPFVVLGLYSQMGSAQLTVAYDKIDSIFKKVSISESDWVIAIAIQDGGDMPMYDSLGMVQYTVPTGTILFLNIGGKFYSQKITHDVDPKTFETIWVIAPLQPTAEISKLNYNPDSLALASEEYIYPFIYKRELQNTYDIQEPSGHRSRYGMYFKTVKNQGYFRFFNDIDLEETLFRGQPKNVNYSYNVSTFTYRCFRKLFELTYQLKL